MSEQEHEITVRRPEPPVERQTHEHEPREPREERPDNGTEKDMDSQS